MEKPQQIKEFYERHKWIPVLIFGISIGVIFTIFVYSERNEFLNTQISEYRERIGIKSSYEGPYRNYTNKELKERVIKVANQIYMLCQSNPLLSIEKHYREQLTNFRKNPSGFNETTPFNIEGVWYINDPEYLKVLDSFHPIITEKDIGKTYGEINEEIYKKIQEHIKPELERYDQQYKTDVIELRTEMLLRMSPKALRHYEGHIWPENPKQFLIGVAIQLEEMSEEF